jgi:hypothetical protein
MNGGQIKRVEQSYGVIHFAGSNPDRVAAMAKLDMLSI